MGNTISTTITAICLLFAVAGGVSAADDNHRNTISQVQDFSPLATLLEQKRVPLVLMFSSEHCAYCVRVESEFLIPMQISGDYDNRAIIRKVEIDSGNELVDFSGQRLSADQFASRYHIYVTPTVVFLDHHGNQLAPKRVGLMTPDFYGGYLDDSIATALDILRRNKPLRVSQQD
ncbi:MAG: thioredoxin fold domain-containing protein [Chromatiales bacterium]|nr:thioredoxin fold domain-containing protein [Chromatiales bacterium]